MSGKTHIERALLEQYILGLTTEEECKEIELYLAQNPQVANEVKESQTVIEDFAMDFSINPSERFRRDTLKSLKLEPSVSPKINTSWITGITAIFAFGFGLLTFLLYQQQGKLKNQISVLDNKITQLQNQNLQLNNQKAKINQQFTVLKDVNTNHIHLRGSQLSPKVLIIVYWNEVNESAYVNIIDLPKIPTDKSLQLWADVAGEMVNMGVLEASKNEFIKVPYIPNTESLNITLEPKGGSEKPNVSQLFAIGKML